MSGLSSSIVEAIFADLRDRRFLKWLFDAKGDECFIGRHDDGEELRGIDLEVQQDIRATWAAIIASRISQQDAELERVRREVAEAREALKPFAERAARFDDIPGIYRCNDNVELWQDGNWRCDLTVGDLRKARSAVAGICETEETRT